jgi:predicted ATPase with chaperone activity
MECTCGSARLSRYQERFSGPFLDRFQIGLVLGREADSVAVPWDEMVFKLRLAQERQRARGPWLGNSGIPLESLIQCAEITRQAMDVLNGWHKKSGLGLRALHHAMRLARTAADWGQRAKVSEQDAWLSISLHASQFRITSKSGPWGLARSSST